MRWEHKGVAHRRLLLDSLDALGSAGDIRCPQLSPTERRRGDSMSDPSQPVASGRF